MVSFEKKSTDENLRHVARLRALIEDQLEGAEGWDEFNATVSIVELACMEPGCPPRETVISVLEKGKQPLKFTVLKPMAEVSDGDAADGFARAVRGDGSVCEHRMESTPAAATPAATGPVPGPAPGRSPGPGR